MGSPSVKILLDSVILIDHFNGVYEATEYLRRTRSDTVISVVTLAEVLTGFAANATNERKLLDEYPLLDVTKSIAALAANTDGNSPTHSRPPSQTTTN